MKNLENNTNRNEIECINQAIKEIAEELFKTCEKPDSKHMEKATEEIQNLIEKRTLLYYMGRRGA